MKYRIEDIVFELAPRFFRGVVVGRGVSNAGLAAGLETELRDRISAIEKSLIINADDPRLAAWRRLYKSFPTPPGERIRSSVVSLISRIRSGHGSAIPFISPLVAISNLTSLTYLCPSGLIDLSQVSGDLVLGAANGNETFVAFGQDEMSVPERGEIIYYDDAKRAVLCRAWNSRGAKVAGIRKETEYVVYDVDGLLDIYSGETLQSATQYVADHIGTYCGGKTMVFFLTTEHREVEFQPF